MLKLGTESASSLCQQIEPLNTKIPVNTILSKCPKIASNNFQDKPARLQQQRHISNDSNYAHVDQVYITLG